MAVKPARLPDRPVGSDATRARPTRVGPIPLNTKCADPGKGRLTGVHGGGEYLDEVTLTVAAGNLQPHLVWATLQYCSDSEITVPPPATRTYPDLDGDPVTFIELGNWRDGAPNWAVRLDHVLEREGCDALQGQYDMSVLSAEENWGMPPNEVEARYALDIGPEAGCDWATHG